MPFNTMFKLTNRTTSNLFLNSSGSFTSPMIMMYQSNISSVLLIFLTFRLILTVHSDNSPLKFHQTAPGDTLYVQPGSSFKIALFADLHFGEDAWTNWGPRQDVNSVSVMSTVLDEEQPGEGCNFKGTTRLELMMNEVEMSKLSYSNFGPKDLWPSVSNYVLKLTSADDPKSVIAYMYFLDSGGGSYPEVISNAQAEWFNRTSLEINPDSRVPEIIFWHIPSQAYKTASPRFYAHKGCIGSLFMEKVAAQEVDLGMMKLLEGRSSAKAVFVAHNHGLDWCCPYKKMWLCYARHSGYGGYGNWLRGARILEITQQSFSLKSWIRMEDGNVHSEVLLSA